MLSAISVGGGAVDGSVRVWLRLEGSMATGPWHVSFRRSGRFIARVRRRRSLRLNRRSSLCNYGRR